MWQLPAVCLLALLFTCLPTPSTSLDLPDLGKLFSSWSGRNGAEPVKKMAPKQHVRAKRQSSAAGDTSQLPYEAETSTLPVHVGTTRTNERYMPTISNGYIGTTVYSNLLYINGLYTGTGASSHRAAIPSVVTARVLLGDDDLERQSVRRYKFNVNEGVFLETIDSPFAYIEHRTYVHSKYIRLFVTDIQAKRKDGQFGGVFQLVYPEMNVSTDIRFEEPQKYESEWKVSGRTSETESGSPVNVYAYYFERLRSVSLRSNPYVRETMIMAADIHEGAAKNDFDAARRVIGGNRGSENLLKEHTDTWKKIWDMGKVEVFGDLRMAKITAFAQYYLYSSFPTNLAYQPTKYDQVLYGYGRTSLAKGGKDKDYRGHVFWDMEMYMLPAVVLFRPDIAKSMLRYRASGSEEAKQFATDTNHEGYRFPWESAFRKSDVTPDTCIGCRERAFHVTAAVGWALRQYYSATRDKDITTNPAYNGCDMTREIARFWAGKAVYNTSKGRYDINEVMGPDDWHPKVNNNAYTNVMASLAIHWGRYFACICNRNERNEVPDEWIQKALYLDLPFDNVKRLHYQYEGFEKEDNRTHKQADTIMLTYPVSWNMSVDIMRNDLMFYELYLSDNTPALTHSFFTVGWKRVKEQAKMINSFLKSYQDFVIQPFKVWSEYNEQSEADQRESTVNFLPGMGGFLQSLIYGFAGVRVRPEFLEFHDPTPPPDCDSMMLSGFKYLGTSMNINIERNRVVIEVIDTEDGGAELLLQLNQTYSGSKKLTIGSLVTVDKPEEGFYLLSDQGTTCDHPRDYIFMPWGYSPWISSAPPTHTWGLSLLFSCLSFLSCLLLSGSLPRLSTVDR